MNAGYELSSGYIGATMKDQGIYFIEKTKITAFKDTKTGQCKVNQDDDAAINVFYCTKM